MEKIPPTILFAALLAAAAAGCENKAEKEYREYRVEQALTLVERLIGELSTRCSETLKPQIDEGKTVLSDRYYDVSAVSTEIVEGGVANTRPIEDSDGLATINSEEDVCTCNEETCSHADNWAISTDMTDRISLRIDKGKSRVSADTFHNSAFEPCEHEEPELNDDGSPVLEFSGETGTAEPVMRMAGHDCTDVSAIELDSKKKKCMVEVEGGEKFKAPDFARCKRIFVEARRVQSEIRAAIGKRTADLKGTHRPQQR